MKIIISEVVLLPSFAKNLTLAHRDASHLSSEGEYTVPLRVPAPPFPSGTLALYEREYTVPFWVPALPFPSGILALHKWPSSFHRGLSECSGCSPNVPCCTPAHRLTYGPF